MDKYIGKRLDGRYEIQEIIGVGGMAYVYKAYDSIDDRVVAIKVLKDEFLANEEFTRRFKNESKAIAILNHPNIVKVYDVSFSDRLQYIVMEYIDGITLKEYIEQQKDIKWKEAVHFTVQILRALQHAHDKGIVHRDIKPQNIMLLADGTIKVTDFGIARFARHELRQAALSDRAIGSVHYISPEQARGEITDEKADIYSVGVMLYEMLTGRVPFDGDNAVSVAIMQMQSDPKPPRALNPDIPEGLEDITLKAMQKDPAKRYQSAAEMLYDIDEFKRNPSIHFEYTYFIDETPTRFVEAITKVKGDTASDNAPNEEEEEEEEEHKGPPVLPILAAIAGAFVLLGIIFAGVIMAIEIINPSGTELEKRVEVPQFVGRYYDEEEFKKNYADFLSKVKLQVETAYSDTVEKGYIIDQSERAGRSMAYGSTLKITVSKGLRMVQVPEVRENEAVDTYLSRLKSAGLDYVVYDQVSDTHPPGTVIQTQPQYPTEVEVGSRVMVFVSSKVSAEPQPVPNVERTTKEAAQQLLEQKGFILDKVTVVNHDTYAANTVISQDPPADTLLPPGSLVNIVVSSGFKDVKNVMLQLPHVQNRISLKVLINGVEQGPDKPEYSTNLQSIDPTLYPNRTMSFTFTEQLESYTVQFLIAPVGSTAYKPYAEYKVNGKTGTAELVNFYPFEPAASTTSTTRSSTTTTTSTTSTVSGVSTSTTETTTTTTRSPW